MTFERVFAWIGLAILAVGLIAVSIWKPGSSGFFPPCPVHALTGLYCPGCGSTRMLYYLAHAQPWTAFRYNPLAFVCLPFLVAAMLCSAFAIKVCVPAQVTGFIRTWSYPAGLAFFFLVVAFTIARNIPVMPFCALAPGGC